MSDWSIFVSTGGMDMFEPNKKRYLTKGVDREVPFDVQLFC